MKKMLNYKSLIKVAIMIVVIALIGSQMMDTEAGRRNNRGGTTGGGQDGGKNGKAECPTCCDAWDKQLGEDRFVLVLPTEANPNGEAVLDKETCLVWEQAPDTIGYTWASAINHCFAKIVGGRWGWRLPTMAELSSLMDSSQSNPALPDGYPFSNVLISPYWSSTTAASSDGAWYVHFDAGIVSIDSKSTGFQYWCVRGGDHDAY